MTIPVGSVNQPLRVRLTADQFEERSQELAGKVLHIGDLRERKKAAAKKAQEEIDSEQEDAEALARVIQQFEEERAQGDLFAQDFVVGTLAKVAETCTEIEALSCPVHGTCACVQPEADSAKLQCYAHPAEAAACIGLSAETPVPHLPGCNLCCDHEGGLCRPASEEDQPKPVPPTTAPAVAAIDCPLHGANTEHNKPRPAPVEEPKKEDEETDEDRQSINDALAEHAAVADAPAGGGEGE